MTATITNLPADTQLGLHAAEEHACDPATYHPDECPPCLRASCGHGECGHNELINAADPLGRFRSPCTVDGCDCDRFVTDAECARCDGAGGHEDDHENWYPCGACGGHGVRR